MADSPEKPEKPEGALEDFGIKGLLDPAGEDPFLVAPTTGSLFNTLSIDLVPVACLQLHDVTFGFDSSFVTRAAAAHRNLRPRRSRRRRRLQQGAERPPRPCDLRITGRGSGYLGQSS